MTVKAKHFYDYLAAGNIICNSRAANSNEAINEMIELLSSHRVGLDPVMVRREVMERERVFPTVIAPGLAVPHARLLNLTEPLVALLTSPVGMDFGSPDMGLVKVAILLLTPGDDPGLHLQLLAALAKDFGSVEKVEDLSKLSAPKEVMNFLTGSPLQIPDYLRVREIMNPAPVTILEQATLQEAIRVFARSGVEELPVVDDSGDLRGLLSLSDLLKFSLPEHILWLDDLSSMYHFQPFSEVLKSARETKVADIMREDYVSVGEGIPAIQLAKLFLKHQLRQLVVVDDNGKLAGVVELKVFSAKLFWE